MNLTYFDKKFFKSKKPHFEHLRKKWTAKNKAAASSLVDKHLRKVAAGSLGGLMLLTTPSLSIPAPHMAVEQGGGITAVEDKNRLLAAELIDKLPKDMSNLSREQEKNVEELLSKDFGFSVKGEIDNKRLNRTYGMIGGEQHLYRYPGDGLHSHANNLQDWVMYGGSGIAPGLGAYGYFAPSKEEFTKKDEERERYYLAVQTFLSPGFSERVREYRDFYKFRKMLVVNPKTGQAVVAVIGDAGPAEWTGKHLGGSPEVMHHLGLAGGPRKGAVLYFFVDDPQDQVPLGPIKVPDNLLAGK